MVLTGESFARGNKAEVNSPMPMLLNICYDNQEPNMLLGHVASDAITSRLRITIAGNLINQSDPILSLVFLT